MTRSSGMGLAVPASLARKSQICHIILCCVPHETEIQLPASWCWLQVLDAAQETVSVKKASLYSTFQDCRIVWGPWSQLPIYGSLKVLLIRKVVRTAEPVIFRPVNICDWGFEQIMFGEWGTLEPSAWGSWVVLGVGILRSLTWTTSLYLKFPATTRKKAKFATISTAQKDTLKWLLKSVSNLPS